MRGMLLVCALGLCCASALGSEPGEPLSEEDWVIVLPDLTVDLLVPLGPVCQDSDLTCPDIDFFAPNAVGADGSVYYLVQADGLTGPPLCGENSSGVACFRRELRRFGPDCTVETVAYLDERVGLPSDTRDKVRDMRQPYWVCSSKRTRDELGWSPTMQFAEGAEETARWYRDNGWL